VITNLQLHFWLFCLTSSDFTTLNCFLHSTDASLSVSSVNHLLKSILCRLERQHVLEPFNFLFSNATTGSIFVTAETGRSSKSVTTEVCVLMVLTVDVA
jgi:hypothetical protein